MPEKISSACGRRSDTIAGHHGLVTLSKPIQTPSRSSCHVQQCPLRVPPSGLTVVRVNRVPRTVVAGSHFALSRSAARAEAADVVGEHVRIVLCMFSISSFFSDSVSNAPPASAIPASASDFLRAIGFDDDVFEWNSRSAAPFVDDDVAARGTTAFRKRRVVGLWTRRYALRFCH